jgi:hypothetical protein
VSKKGRQDPKVRMPKSKCCVSKDKCRRCPLLMLKQGTLPAGYAVKKRKLVKVDGAKQSKKQKLPAAA